MGKVIFVLGIAFSLFFIACKKEDTPTIHSPSHIDSPIVEDTLKDADTVYFNLDASQAPKFVSVNYIELDSIQRISMFRSGVGHDYSDGFEACRSMKHYYQPKTKEWNKVKIFSPVDGKIVRMFDEWAGTQIQIESSLHPAFIFILFHVKKDSSLIEGSQVYAGQLLGKHISNQTSSDIAVFVKYKSKPTDSLIGQKSYRFFSYFQVMSHELLEKYKEKGITNLDSIIISKSARDANPIICDGEAFVDPGKLKNWFYLK